METTHVALYRKYRPQKFSEVLGQDHITRVLSGSIELERISHAYLFAGTRGTGKTSVARIFAKEIGTSGNDIHEIDAASNTGVDDIRALNESVSVLPFESKYKVYIIDEVHMLSKSAFNALLKTLEEPPQHVIFILATTEIDKLPETVVSRCQVFSFKRPTSEVLATVVGSSAKKEGFSFEKSSTDLIAVLADGSFRDALGILQKVISSSKDKKVSTQEVEVLTGAPRGQAINELILAFEKGELEESLLILESLSSENIDIKILAKLLLRKLRFILLLRYAPRLKDIIVEKISDEDFSFIAERAGDKDSRINNDTLIEFLSAYDKTMRSSIPELPLELALVNLLSSVDE